MPQLCERFWTETGPGLMSSVIPSAWMEVALGVFSDFDYDDSVKIWVQTPKCLACVILVCLRTLQGGHCDHLAVNGGESQCLSDFTRATKLEDGTGWTWTSQGWHAPLLCPLYVPFSWNTTCSELAVIAVAMGDREVLSQLIWIWLSQNNLI
jgi:hypothetical protein